jgi:hypothetical protein
MTARQPRFPDELPVDVSATRGTDDRLAGEELVADFALSGHSGNRRWRPPAFSHRRHRAFSYPINAKAEPSVMPRNLAPIRPSACTGR